MQIEVLPVSTFPNQAARSASVGGDAREAIRALTWNDRFVQLWLAVIPITSVLVIPSIQGTTPATLSAALSLLCVFCAAPAPQRTYVHRLTIVLAIFLTLQMFSIYAISGLKPGPERYLQFLNPFDPKRTIQPSIPTQSLYLFVAGITAIYAWVFADRRWHDWLFAGPLLLVGYGLYEWIYFFLTHESGDFISNRTFVDHISGSAERFTGSVVQSVEPLGVPVLRMKSLTGEPSMFALTVLPYFFFAVHTGRRAIAAVLLVGLVLSTSSTAIISIAFGLVLSFLLARRTLIGRQGSVVGVLILMAALVALFSSEPGQKLAKYVVTDIQEKATGEGTSGSERIESHVDAIEFFAQAPLGMQLFGLGFGVTRPLAFFDWLLINCGILGLLVWLAMFLYPVVRMDSATDTNVGLKVALCTALFAMFIGVPEFSYPSTWLFLGLAYSRVGCEVGT